MSKRWAVGEQRFLGLAGKSAWIAAVAIVGVFAMAAAAILWFFGWNWIGGAVALFGIALLLAWFQISQYMGWAWFMAASASEEERQRRPRR